MTPAVINKGLLSSIRTMIGMAIDPIECMRNIGLSSPTAMLMKLGPDLRRSRGVMYLTGAENVRPIFMDTDTFHTSNPPMKYPGGGAQARLRRGIIGNQGAEHRHYRSSIVKQTGRTMMSEFSNDVARKVDARLRGMPDDEPIDLVELITDLVRYYAVVSMFKDETPELALQIGRDIAAWVELAYDPRNILAPFNIPGLPHARFRRSAETLEAKVLQWAAARRGMDPGRDILSMFVNGPDENGKPLSEDRIAGHVFTFYAASFSSSVSTLIWLMFLIMQHPEVAHDLCDEIEGSGIDPLTDGLKFLELPLLDRVLKESTRLFTPVPYLVRRVTRATECVGTPLKANDKILIGAWATNRLASVYPDADRFRPDRWLNADAGSFDYLSFGGGPRRCVGYGLAMIIVKITLASILLKRRPSLVPNSRIDTKVAVNIRSRQPIPVMMSNRNARMSRADIRGTVSKLYVY